MYSAIWIIGNHFVSAAAVLEQFVRPTEQRRTVPVRTRCRYLVYREHCDSALLTRLAISVESEEAVVGSATGPTRLAGHEKRIETGFMTFELYSA
jgi:hypothetical protein